MIEKEKAVIEKSVGNSNNNSSSIDAPNSPMLVISDVSHVSNVNKKDNEKENQSNNVSMIRGVSPKDILNIPETFESTYCFHNQLQQLMGNVYILFLFYFYFIFKKKTYILI